MCVALNLPFSHKATKLVNHNLLFSRSLECSKVTALFKSGDRTNATNYRPISILPTLSKILERTVHSQLYEYLDVNQILTDKQFGFRPKHSTITALSSFADEVLVNMERGKLCGAVFLDLSKAFDTVDHGILIFKLKTMASAGLRHISPIGCSVHPVAMSYQMPSLSTLEYLKGASLARCCSSYT